MYDFDFGPIILLGAAMTIQIMLVVPPGSVWFLWWLLAPHLGVAGPTLHAFLIMLGIWSVPVAAFVASIWWPRKWR